jgi:hypothetical protein
MIDPGWVGSGAVIMNQLLQAINAINPQVLVFYGRLTAAWRSWTCVGGTGFRRRAGVGMLRGGFPENQVYKPLSEVGIAGRFAAFGVK